MKSFNQNHKKKIQSRNLGVFIFAFFCFILGNKTADDTDSCQSDACRFSNYVRENEIHFVSPLEKVYRFRIFKRNLREIESFNQAHPEIKLNLNGFGLLTRNEFKEKMTNPDFLFVDVKGRKHHVNVNDPRNEEVIDEKILQTNNETLKAIQGEIYKKGKANALTMLEWDIENADSAVQRELDNIHDFLGQHGMEIEDHTELLDADGCRTRSVEMEINRRPYSHGPNPTNP